MNKSQTFARATSAVVVSVTLAFSGAAWGKLPAPSDDAKAKAAEAAAKTAHAGKVSDYQLCQSMDKVAARYLAAKKKAGDEVKPPTATPPCADPGAFVYPPPAAGAPATAAVAAAATAAPAAAAAAGGNKPSAAASAPKK